VKSLPFVVMGLSLWSRVAGQALAPVDTGTFALYSGRERIGTERYAVYADSFATSAVELNVMGREVRFEVRVRYRGGNPIGYELTQAPNIKLTAEFTGTQAKITSPAGARELTLPGGTVIVENNVIEHHALLLQRYDLQAKGKQTIPILVPSVMMATQAEVEYLATSTEMINQQPHRIHRFRVVVAGMVSLDLTCDERLRILNESIPAQNMEVVRAGYEAFRSPPNIPDVHSDTFHSLEVAVPSTEAVTLAGTLTLPKKAAAKYPAVVLISGSGPQDREENTPPALNLYLFRYIANALAAEGLAVLRCDDRGVGKSTGNFRKGTLKDFIADARAQVAFLRGRDDIDPRRIAVLGHSEGGCIASILAAEDRDVAACVILASSSKPLDALLIEQLEYQASNEDFPESVRATIRDLMAPTRQVIADAKAGKDSSTALPYNLDWLRQHFTHDPLATITKVKCPVLILQGEKDVLVPPYHAKALDKALADAGNRDHRVVVFPNLTHLFTQYPYHNPDYKPEKANELSPAMLDTLRAWMVQRFR